MKTICIDGPAKGRVIAVTGPSFRYPVRERAVLESALRTDLPTPQPCPTVEYRLARYDAEKILSVEPDKFPDESVSLTAWSFARLVARGHYDVRSRQYIVWQSC